MANSIKSGKVFDQIIIDVATSYMKPGSIVLDIGANYGQMSIILFKLFKGDCTVYAFEAQEMVFNILKKKFIGKQLYKCKGLFKCCI